MIALAIGALVPLLAASLLTGCPAIQSGANASESRCPALETLPEDALIDLACVDPSIRLDMRYATPNNFTGVAVYPIARCRLRKAVAERLARVQRDLEAEGLGLLVWDCYRPISIQQRFFALVPDPRYVAEPVFENGVPVDGSKHNRGAAVDLTLVDAGCNPLEMPTDFDDFSPRAHRSYAGASAAAAANREKLERAMVSEGFAPFPTEWWHFDGPSAERYQLADEPL